MASVPSPSVNKLEPVWELATLYPAQGAWSEGDYLDLTSSTNRLIEFTDGRVEFLTMPTTSHQRILAYLFAQLQAFVTAHQLGEVLTAALRVRIRENKFREPDIVFLHADHSERAHDDFWEGADLVMEIVSNDPESRRRDFEKKRLDYAEAGIPEYWIVDPVEQRITVLVLTSGATEYTEHGVFAPGDKATSNLLAGFEVDVQCVFDAARGK